MIKKIKITEVSEFSIWSYTQNRKFGNLEKFFLLQNLILVVYQDLKQQEMD